MSIKLIFSYYFIRKKNQIIKKNFANDKNKALLENSQNTNKEIEEATKNNQNVIIRINNGDNKNLRSNLIFLVYLIIYRQ